MTEQQATDEDLNLALGIVEDDVATVNDSLTIVDGRVKDQETRLTSVEETATVLDGRIGRSELSGMFNLHQEIRHKIDSLTEKKFAVNYYFISTTNWNKYY